MIKYILLLLITVTSLLACQSSNSSTTSSEETASTDPKAEKVLNRPKALPPKQFAAKIAATSDPQVIDVRTASEYNAGFISGARNIDFYGKTFLEDFKAQVDVKRPVFVYCKSGGRSGKTAAMMSSAGFREVYDLQGGYTAWIKSQQNQLPSSIKAEDQ